MYYWICPNCGISVYEDYLECRCGYVATKKDVESSKVKLEDLEKISKEERRRSQEEYQQALEKKKKEEKLLALEKRKEENKKVLQERLGELKELFDTGIITEEEHNRRRQTILDKFFETNGINQNKLVKKEEAKKEIKQGYINKNQLTSKHANRTYDKTNSTISTKNSLFSTQPTDLKFGGYTLIFLGGINIIIGFFGIIGATIFQFIVGLILLGLGFGALKHSSFLYIGTIIWSLGFVIFCINYFTDSQTQRYPAAIIIQSWFLWQLIRATPAYGKFYNRKR